MSQRITTKEERIEDAMEYIQYAKEKIENDYPDAAEELSWIFGILEEDLQRGEK